MEYMLAIDQGTTGTTCALINADSFQFVDKVNQEYPQIYPSPGWVEHNLNDIWNSVRVTCKQLLERNNVSPKKIKCIGITNQRETTCAFDQDGEPIANAIVWQDRRTSEYCAKLRNDGKEEFIKEKTGLPIDPYFSASKMRWLLENNNDVKEAEKNLNLRFGTIETFLLFKLTNDKSYYTEPSNASRTLLMNLKTNSWDPELLNMFGIKESFLPQIKDSFSDFGQTEGLDFLPDGIPITGMLGDQQSALFGQAGYRKGDMKCTYGTGAFILLNTGEEIKRSKSGLLSTVAYQHKGRAYYALEGSCYIAGAAVGWLRDNLKIIKKSSDVERLAKKVTNLAEMENIQFFPFFTGIGSPYWNADAKGAIMGLTRDTKDSHLARACLDGIALSINDLINALINDTGIAPSSLRVDGGASANNLLMSIQATISNTEIIRPQIIETTAYGAAFASAIGLGLIDFDKIDTLWNEDRRFAAIESERKLYEIKKERWTAMIKSIYL
ncbi:MAG: glycerol kinase [Bacteriovoracaceae bacterium]|nr:glycerol kinase [Bacteriovoracaceae bacterium]